MKTKQIFFLSLALLGFKSHIKADTFCESRVIDIDNNSNVQMVITANCTDLKIEHIIPSKKHSVISVKSSSVNDVNKLMMDAILNNSIDQLLAALKFGASVNMDLYGKKPLELAILLNHLNLVKILVSYGATL